MSFTSFCLLTILAHVSSVQAGGLRRQPPPAQMTRTDVETLLMTELSNTFRGGAAREHISSLEVDLQGMFTAVPKDASGRLGHDVVRYILHRFFSQKYGWALRGLEKGNASALGDWLLAGGNQAQLTLQKQQEWVPGYLQDFIEEMQGGRGINLRELAVLAVTFEDVLHKESNQRVEMTFTALDLPFTSLLNEGQLQEALEVNLMVNTWSGRFFGRFDIKGRESVLQQHQGFVRWRKDWDAMQQWARSIQMAVAPSSIDKPLDFADFSRVAEEVRRKFGTYNNHAEGNQL